jgi:hypothetical protein
MDFGTSYQTGWNDVTINMTIQNFGPGERANSAGTKYSPPLNFRMGISADVLDFAGMSDHPTSFVVAIEGEDPRDREEKFNIGGELHLEQPNLPVSLDVRGGYSTREEAGGISFGSGASFKMSG